MKHPCKHGLFLTGLLLSACNHAPSENAGAPANAPVSNAVVRMADGADLAWVRNVDKVHPQFYLTPPDVESPLIFAVVRTDTDNGVPVILKKTPGVAPSPPAASASATTPATPSVAGWRILQVMDAAKQEWVYVAACPERNEIWAVLDQAGDVKSWQLTLLRSTDQGASWQFYAAVKKPANSAIYAGFALAKNGQGRITMHLEEDTDNHAHGYYHFRTTDGGHTWTGPTPEANDVAEADPFGTEDTLQDALKDAE